MFDSDIKRQKIHITFKITQFFMPFSMNVFNAGICSDLIGPSVELGISLEAV